MVVEDGIDLEGALRRVVGFLRQSGCHSDDPVTDIEPCDGGAYLDDFTGAVIAQNGWEFEPRVHEGCAVMLNHHVNWVYGNGMVLDDDFVSFG